MRDKNSNSEVNEKCSIAVVLQHESASAKHVRDHMVRLDKISKSLDNTVSLLK
jgi:hypothetical protein